MKTLLIMQLFQINKSSCKHSHKKRMRLSKVYCTGSICDNFIICGDLHNCLTSLCTVAIRTENEIEKENSHCKQPFCCFDVFLVRPPQKFQVHDKIPTIRPLFPDYLSVSYDYVVKLQKQPSEVFCKKRCS